MARAGLASYYSLPQNNLSAVTLMIQVILVFTFLIINQFLKVLNMLPVTLLFEMLYYLTLRQTNFTFNPVLSRMFTKPWILQDGCPKYLRTTIPHTPWDGCLV